MQLSRRPSRLTRHSFETARCADTHHLTAAVHCHTASHGRGALIHSSITAVADGGGCELFGAQTPRPCYDAVRPPVFDVSGLPAVLLQRAHVICACFVCTRQGPERVVCIHSRWQHSSPPPRQLPRPSVCLHEARACRTPRPFLLRHSRFGLQCGNRYRCISPLPPLSSLRASPPVQCQWRQRSPDRIKNSSHISNRISEASRYRGKRFNTAV